MYNHILRYFPQFDKLLHACVYVSAVIDSSSAESTTTATTSTSSNSLVLPLTLGIGIPAALIGMGMLFFGSKVGSVASGIPSLSRFNQPLRRWPRYAPRPYVPNRRRFILPRRRFDYGYRNNMIYY